MLVKKLGKKEPETWICLICGEENPGDDDLCQSCAATKEERIKLINDGWTFIKTTETTGISENQVSGILNDVQVT